MNDNEIGIKLNERKKELCKWEAVTVLVILYTRNSDNLGESKMLNTHVKSVFIDHEHAHVLGQQFAGVSYRKTKDEILCFFRENVLDL